MSRSPAFTRESVRAAIRPQAARGVVRRVRYDALIVVDVVSPATGRRVYLVNLLIGGRLLKCVGQECHALVLGHGRQGVRWRLLRLASCFLGVRVARSGRCRVKKLVGPKDGDRNVLTPRLLRRVKSTRSVASWQVVTRSRVFGIVGSRFQEDIFMQLCFVSGRLYLFFSFILQGNKVRGSVHRRFRYSSRILNRGYQVSRDFLFVNVHVRVTARVLRTIRSVPDLPFPNAFGGGVLCGIDRSLFVFNLVANSNVCNGSTVDRLQEEKFVGGTGSVKRNVCVVLRFYANAWLLRSCCWIELEARGCGGACYHL